MVREAGYSRLGGRSRGIVAGRNGVLVHRDGHRVAFVAEGTDERGEYLVIEHVWVRPGLMAGPHWHPVLTETFRVWEGRMRLRVDGREFVLGPGDGVSICPGEVHRFWNEGERPLRVVHEVRPCGHHREMFELWHRLDLAGKTNRQGVPGDPLALGLMWELQDGYLAGVPAWIQRIVFGGLARLARSTRYEERLERVQAHEVGRNEA
jgi:mannose-6-phosphate isomerase-like protein (cupin superfamily)